MTDIQSVGEQLHMLVIDSKKSVTCMYNAAANLRRSAETIQHVLQGTSKRNYQDILNYLRLAQSNLKKATALLENAVDYAQEWVEHHISTTANSFSETNPESGIDESSSNGFYERARVLTQSIDEVTAIGLRAIDAQMEMIRDDCRDKGIFDNIMIESIVKEKREAAEIEFYNDLFGKVEERAQESLNRFSPFLSKGVWEQLDHEKRVDILNSLAADVGAAYRTTIKGVVFYQGPSYSRGYYNGDGYLYMNSDCISDPENRLDALDTIFHEGRHAFQHAAIRDPHRYGITEEQAQIWDYNFKHYLSSERFGYERYYTQPVEADAFSFADSIINQGVV